MLNDLRAQIDALDAELVTLICKRIDIARRIAKIKKENGLPILDEGREEEVCAAVRKMAKEKGLSAHVLEEIMKVLLDYTRLEMGVV